VRLIFQGSLNEVPLILDTERLRLRPITSKDTGDLLLYHSDPAVVRYIPWTVRSSAEVETAIANYATLPMALNHEGDSIVLGWELKSSGKVIGQSNASLVSLVNQTADVGWVTSRGFWRQGYAYEASAAFIDFVFSQAVVRRIVANIDTRNPESARLAEKLKMRLEGEFRQSIFTKGEWCDMWQYAALREEINQ
jgi:RimJ/RimL family protein N-acetyltransferase